MSKVEIISQIIPKWTSYFETPGDTSGEIWGVHTPVQLFFTYMVSSLYSDPQNVGFSEIRYDNLEKILVGRHYLEKHC